MAKLQTFTTRVDTIYAVTFLVMAPEHPEVLNLTKESQKSEVLAYIERTKGMSERDRQINKEKTGVFTGSYVKHPLTGNKLPIWIADFVLPNYGTGIVMADAHDQRDVEFAKKYNIPLKETITPFEKEKVLIIHDIPNKNDLTEERISDNFWYLNLKEKLLKKGLDCFLPEMPDTLNPSYDLWKNTLLAMNLNLGSSDTAIAHGAGAVFLSKFIEKEKITLSRLIVIAPKSSTASQNSQLQDFYKKTDFSSKLKDLVKNIVVILSDDDSEEVFQTVKKYTDTLQPKLITLPSKGHFLQKEFPELLEFLDSEKLVFTADGILFDSGEFSGLTSEEARTQITEKLEKEGLGKKQINYKFRDWVFSRQRYWGEPFPFEYLEAEN